MHVQAQGLLEQELQEYRERIAALGEKKRQRMKETQAQELKVLRHRLLNNKEEGKKKRVQQARHAQGRIKISNVKLNRNHKRGIVEKRTEAEFAPDPDPTPALQNIYAMSPQQQQQAATDISAMIDFDEPAPDGTIIVHSAAGDYSEIPVATTKYNQPAKSKRPSRRNSRTQSQSARPASSGAMVEDSTNANANANARRRQESKSSTSPKTMTEAELELQRKFDEMLMSDTAVGDIEKVCKLLLDIRVFATFGISYWPFVYCCVCHTEIS